MDSSDLRLLDKRIAAEVMGWTLLHHYREWDSSVPDTAGLEVTGLVFFCDPRDGQVRQWSPTTDPRDSARLEEKLIEMKWWPSLVYRSNNTPEAGLPLTTGWTYELRWVGEITAATTFAHKECREDVKIARALCALKAVEP